MPAASPRNSAPPQWDLSLDPSMRCCCGVGPGLLSTCLTLGIVRGFAGMGGALLLEELHKGGEVLFDLHLDEQSLGFHLVICRVEATMQIALKAEK